MGRFRDSTECDSRFVSAGCVLLDAALAYSQRGWLILPVNPKTKAPLRPHENGGRGHLDATTDSRTIRDWWTRWPDAAIGYRPAEDEVVVDVDPRNGGDRSFQELTDRLGPLPPTLTTITGGGGQHYRLRIPLGLRLPKELAPGVDLKGWNGYVVLSPSGHPLGTAYAWAAGRSPEEQDAALLPEAWLDEIRRLTSAETHKASATSVEGMIPEGKRNRTLASLAGTMRRRGMSTKAIEAALIVENRNRCDPQLPKPEVRRIAESIGRYEPTPEAKPVGSPDGGAAVGENESGCCRRISPEESPAPPDQFRSDVQRIWSGLALRDRAGEEYLESHNLWKDGLPDTGFLRFSTGETCDDWVNARAADGYRLAFAVRRPDGKMQTIALRHVGGGRNHGLAPTLPGHSISRAVICRPEILLLLEGEPEFEHDEIAIVEGPMNFLAFTLLRDTLYSDGHARPSWTLGCIGAGQAAGVVESFGRIIAGRTLRIALDPDTAGEQNARKAADAAHRVGAKRVLRCKPRDPDMDVADVLRRRLA